MEARRMDKMLNILGGEGEQLIILTYCTDLAGFYFLFPLLHRRFVLIQTDYAWILRNLANQKGWKYTEMSKTSNVPMPTHRHRLLFLALLEGREVDSELSQTSRMAKEI
jgi:hypothetical protein